MATKKANKFSIFHRITSFKFAFNGLKIFFKFEHNARLHVFLAILTCVFGFLFNVTNTEWLTVIVVIGLVFLVEIINTVIEHLADFISPEENPKIKIIKDLAAASVLVASFTALLVGIIIFLPKILDFIF